MSKSLGVVLVMLSLFVPLVPAPKLSLPSCKLGAPGVAGAVLSIVTISADEVATLPAISVCLVV